MHLHYAASQIGNPAWLAAAKAFVLFCRDFSQIAGRAVTVIDFGGGWNSYQLDDPSLREQLHELLQTIRSFPGHIPEIQFEPGTSYDLMNTRHIITCTT